MPSATVELHLARSETDIETGTITAFTMDDKGNPLADVEVTISGPVTRTKVAGDNHAVSFNDVPVDDYTITATYVGDSVLYNYEDDQASIVAGDFV